MDHSFLRRSDPGGSVSDSKTKSSVRRACETSIAHAGVHHVLSSVNGRISGIINICSAMAENFQVFNIFESSEEMS